MLRGRGEECARIEALMADARAGRSSALVVRGDAGIGKSALLEHAVHHASGMTVLRARGVEAESEIAYSGLWDLARPGLDRLDELPEPQARALLGALALGPPHAADRFTVCAATLGLLAAIAEEHPVLVAVDDAQWLDAASAEALAFAARRLEAEGVVVLVAVRDAPTAFDKARLPELYLGPLGSDAARELLAEAARAPVAPAVADALVEGTGGNPLALVEIPPLLSAAQLAGDQPLEEPLRPGPAVERAFRERVGALSSDGRRALVVAAASAGEVDAVERAAAALGVSHALEEAESAGLVRISGGRVEFPQPLVRAVAYYDAPEAARRAAHAALADASTGVQTTAWHTAEAASGTDGDAAEALEDAARTAARRGGHAAAATALERAAELTAGQAERGRRFLRAADEARLGGQPERALALLDSALATAADPLLRADVQHLRGTVETALGRGADAHALLVAEAERVEEADPRRATEMLVDAAAPILLAGDARGALETARKAVELGERAGGAGEVAAWALLATALILTGDAEEGLPVLRRCQSLLGRGELPTRAYQLVQFAGATFLVVEEFDTARDLLVRVADQARARSAPALLPYALAGLTELDFRTGNWPAAYAAAAEANRLATETGQASAMAYGLLGLARVEAAQGRREECEAHVARVEEVAPGTAAATIFAPAVLGLLELGVGETDRAIDHLEGVGRRLEANGIREPGIAPWAQNLIEAYARAGRRDDAARTLDGLEERARLVGRIGALAGAARCRGIVSDEAWEERFHEALDLHARTRLPFERARTLLAYGERLRRARRPADARAPLHEALDEFERLGATAWSERARSELRASGEAPRRRDPFAWDELTPQELQVALMVARGATNREAGAALFLSPKTIEAHLSRIYRKLDVRSRTELANRLAHDPSLADVA